MQFYLRYKLRCSVQFFCALLQRVSLLITALSMSWFFLLLNSGMAEKFLHRKSGTKLVYVAFQLVSDRPVKVAYLLFWLTAVSNLSLNLDNHPGAASLSAPVTTSPLKSASAVFRSAVPLLENFSFERIATLFRCV